MELPKKEWIEALRSGEYQQGQYDLYNPITKRYCCLGVLNAIMKGQAKRVEASNSDNTPLRYDLISPEDQEQLTNRNDSGRTFAEIADWIEENL